jgi:hypothetical protein
MDAKNLLALLAVQKLASQGLWHCKDNDSDDYHIRVIRFPIQLEELGVINPDSGEKVATVLDCDGRPTSGSDKDAEAIVSAMNNMMKVIRSHLVLHDNYEWLFKENIRLEGEIIRLKTQEAKLKKRVKKNIAG